jgi:hypothetical protein
VLIGEKNKMVTIYREDKPKTIDISNFDKFLFLEQRAPLEIVRYDIETTFTTDDLRAHSLETYVDEIAMTQSKYPEYIKELEHILKLLGEEIDHNNPHNQIWPKYAEKFTLDVEYDDSEDNEDYPVLTDPEEQEYHLEMWAFTKSGKEIHIDQYFNFYELCSGCGQYALQTWMVIQDMSDREVSKK